MAPYITAWEDLHFFHENDDDAGAQCIIFAAFDEDGNAYFGKLNQPKHEITLEQVASALLPIADGDIFPEWAPRSAEPTQAREALPSDAYIKRPLIELYDVFQGHNVLHLIPENFVEEAVVLERISRHPHPNIILYYGCRVRRGHITELVLERHPHSLRDYLKNQIGSVDKGPFMRALTWAIDHLHSLDLAHNDLHPNNILVNDQGMPIFIDFGSCREIGAKLGTSRGAIGWIEGGMGDYHTSETGHDFFALEKIRGWLDAPTFDD